MPAYTLPDPLILLNGKKVTSARAWTRKRRPEILKLFETHVYGRTPMGRPKEMTWEVASEDRDAMGAKGAGPVYALFGKSGVGVDEMPPVSTPVGDTIGFHLRTGSHGQNDTDWEQYLNFADRQFGAPKLPG